MNRCSTTNRPRMGMTHNHRSAPLDVEDQAPVNSSTSRTMDNPSLEGELERESPEIMPAIELTIAPLEDLLQEWFDHLVQGNVRFVIERNHEELPRSMRLGGDLDVLVHPDDAEQAASALHRVACHHDMAISQSFDGACWKQIRMHRLLSNPSQLFVLQVDLKWGEQWRGFPTFDVNAVLARRQAQDCFFIPHPAHEAALGWFGHLLHHGRGKPHGEAALFEAARTTPRVLEELLSSAFGSPLAHTLVADLQAGNIPAIETQTRRLRKAVIGHTVRDLGNRQHVFRDSVARATQWRLSPQCYGLTVALIGPDGCGKSTVAQAVVNTLRHVYLTADPKRLHLRPGFLPPLRDLLRPSRWRQDPHASSPNTSPHEQAPDGSVGSLARLLYYASDYVVGHYSTVAPHARWKRSLVVFERYYYDLIVDPKRMRIDMPDGVAKALLPWIPKPDVVLLLDAPPEMIHARKPELPPYEVARQIKAYRTLVDELFMGHRVDATQNVEQVVHDVCAIALEAATLRSVTA